MLAIEAGRFGRCSGSSLSSSRGSSINNIKAETQEPVYGFSVLDRLATRSEPVNLENTPCVLEVGDKRPSQGYV